MRFEEALKAMREGKRITLDKDKKGWWYYYRITDGVCMQFVFYGYRHEETNTETCVSLEEIMSEDWEIVDE